MAAGSQPVISGTSCWQTLHQWAKKMSTLGRPSRVMLTGVPAKSAPVTSGMVRPRAVSFWHGVELGQGLPR